MRRLPVVLRGRTQGAIKVPYHRRMNYITRRLAKASCAIVVVSLLATACGGSDYANKEMPSPVSGGDLKAADIKDGGKKLSPEELVKAWEEVTGETCAGDINKSDGDEKFAECSDAAIMWSFPDSNDTRERVMMQHKRFSSVNVPASEWLVGPNWIINNRNNHEELFHEIGGVPVTVG